MKGERGPEEESRRVPPEPQREAVAEERREKSRKRGQRPHGAERPGREPAGLASRKGRRYGEDAQHRLEFRYEDGGAARKERLELLPVGLREHDALFLEEPANSVGDFVRAVPGGHVGDEIVALEELAVQ